MRIVQLVPQYLARFSPAMWHFWFEWTGFGSEPVEENAQYICGSTMSLLKDSTGNRRPRRRPQAPALLRPLQLATHLRLSTQLLLKLDLPFWKWKGESTTTALIVSYLHTSLVFHVKAIAGQTDTALVILFYNPHAVMVPRRVTSTPHSAWSSAVSLDVTQIYLANSFCFTANPL
jgi:hypothetical protein